MDKRNRRPGVRPRLTAVTIGVLFTLCALVPISRSETPQIVAVHPGQHELDVSVSSDITITFDVGMDTSTIDDSTIFMYGEFTGRKSVAISYVTSGGPIESVVLDPDVDFDVGELIWVTVTSDVKSDEGSSMGSSYSWSFTATVEGGLGTFFRDEAVGTHWNPEDVRGNDLDGDGDIDAVMLSFVGCIGVFLNSGSRFDQPASFYSTFSELYEISVVDFDGNGKADLVAICGSNIIASCNNGDGTFGPFTSFPTVSKDATIPGADLDGDGDLDLAKRDGSSVSVWLNDGSGTFMLDAAYNAGIVPHFILPNDFDNDGDIDLAAASRESEYISVLLNQGDASFDPYSTSFAARVSTDLCAGDFDADGDCDLVTVYSQSGNMVVLLNDGAGNFPAYSTYSNPLGTVAISSGDLDADGDLDLVTVSVVDSVVAVLLNNGDGTFAPRTDFYCEEPRSVYVADVDGDGDLDLLTADHGGERIWILKNDSICGNANGYDGVNILDATFLIDYLYREGRPPQPAFAGDIDGSGVINIQDVTWLINYLYKNGPEPIC